MCKIFFSGGGGRFKIILFCFYRTTLADQLDSILRQTVAPIGGVWVCLFHSPRELEYRAIVESYRERFKPFGGLFFTASTFNFKYYGRFQLALQARTRYTPNSRFVSFRLFFFGEEFFFVQYSLVTFCAITLK